jgi:RES domain-containing protein
VRKVIAGRAAGMLVPSFANGATADDQNLVLWRWGPDLPHRVMVYDPTGRLPKSQPSWG